MTQSDEEFWKVKIIAFLHDPPTKPWRIGNHEARARELIETVGVELGDESLWELARNADQISAGADRPPLGSQIKQPQVSFKHPVSGESQSFSSVSHVIENAVDSFLKVLSSMKLNLKEKYLLLWRFLPEFLGKDMKYKTSPYMIPADTRWCDHSLWDHLDVTSAIAGALYPGGKEAEKNLALLYVKIPGPQKLISGSKKYKELWGASYMISFIMGKILKVVSEEVGPDSVVYPSLRGNPLFDYLFYSKRSHVKEFLNAIGGNSKRWEEFIGEWARHSLLPNKAIIIVNKGKIPELKEKIKKALEEFFDAFWDKIKEKVETNTKEDHGKIFKECLMRRFFPRLLWMAPGEMFEVEDAEIGPDDDLGNILKMVGLNKKIKISLPKLKGFPDPIQIIKEAFSKAQTFKDLSEAFQNLVRNNRLGDLEKIYRIVVMYYFLMCLIGKKLEIERKTTTDTSRRKPGVYNPKILVFYEIYRRILEAGDKRFSRFYYRLPSEYKPKETSRGITCELCGEAPAAFEYKGRGYEKAALLCPVCLAKILYREAMRELGYPVSYYSSHVDLSVKRYFEKLEEKEEELEDKWEEVKKEIREILRELFEVVGLNVEVEGKKISEIIDKWSKSVGNFPSPEIMIYILRGDFKGIEKEVGEMISRHKEKFEKLCKEISEKIDELEKEAKRKGIDIPERSFAEYFSIVKFDGDSIGKLLSRLVSWDEEEKTLTYFTKDRYVCLEGTSLGKEVLDILRNIQAIPGPLYHREISTAISYFSLCSLQELKRENCEVLYCGGDDFLVIGDPESWLRVLKTLKEKIGKDFGDVPFTILSLEGSIKLLKAYLPSWGGSAGVVISYFKRPLYYVLSLVNEAEEAAKKARGEKKRADAITVLLSSGISEKVRICDKVYVEKGMLKVAKTGSERIKELMEEIRANWKSASLPRYFHSMLDYLSKIQTNSKELLDVISLREIIRHITKGEKRRPDAENLNKEILQETFKDHFSEIKGPLKEKIREEILSMKAIYRTLRWGGELRC